MSKDAKLPADITVRGRTEAAEILPEIFEEGYVAPSVEPAAPEAAEAAPEEEGGQ